MQERDLKLLTANQATLDVQVEKTEGGYIARINGQLLRSARQDVRPFAKLDTVARVLTDAGVTSFKVTIERKG